MVEETTEAHTHANTNTVPSTANAGVLPLPPALAPAATHPTTLQSSASEFPQVESCALLPSLSFGGSTKSNCLGGKSKNEAHMCTSRSAEMHTPQSVHVREVNGKVLLYVTKCVDTGKPVCVSFLLIIFCV